jgi:transcription antitermination protein NusB
MPSRHRSRQRAVQILYQLDVRKLSVDDAVSSFYDTLYSSEDERDEPASSGARPARDRFMEELVHGTAASLGDIDRRISGHSEHWRLERMPLVDRNILRLGVFEMMQGSTPAPVVIDEALELARRFAGDESVPFINGVLDAVRKEMGGAAQ